MAWSLSQSDGISRLGDSTKPAATASVITSRLPFRQAPPRLNLPRISLEYLSAALIDACFPESVAASRAASFLVLKFFRVTLRDSALSL